MMAHKTSNPLRRIQMALLLQDLRDHKITEETGSTGHNSSNSNSSNNKCRSRCSNSPNRCSRSNSTLIRIMDLWWWWHPSFRNLQRQMALCPLGRIQTTELLPCLIPSGPQPMLKMTTTWGLECAISAGPWIRIPPQSAVIYLIAVSVKLKGHTLMPNAMAMLTWLREGLVQLINVIGMFTLPYQSYCMEKIFLT